MKKNKSDKEVEVPDQVTRVVLVEVGYGSGRIYDKRDLKNVTTSLQDNNKTLKIFIEV